MEPSDVQFTVNGTATATSGVQRVQLEVQERDTKRYLQDDLITWGNANTINVNLASPNATSTTWSLPLTIAGNHRIKLMAKTYGVNGSSDASKAIKKIETFGLADQTPDHLGQRTVRQHHPDDDLHRHGHRAGRRRRQLDHVLVP